MLFASIIAGYALSASISHELRKSQKDAKKILDFLFLHKEEKVIIRCLVENKGNCKQSEIARLPGMNSVKAFRSLQKMKEKEIIDISIHGKIRKIALKDHLQHLLLEHDR